VVLLFAVSAFSVRTRASYAHIYFL